jgi:hypothetical protein
LTALLTYTQVRELKIVPVINPASAYLAFGEEDMYNMSLITRNIDDLNLSLLGRALVP